MSISIHIPFYNPNSQKKEGYRQLTRFDFLKDLQTLWLPHELQYLV